MIGSASHGNECMGKNNNRIKSVHAFNADHFYILCVWFHIALTFNIYVFASIKLERGDKLHKLRL